MTVSIVRVTPPAARRVPARAKAGLGRAAAALTAGTLVAGALTVPVAAHPQGPKAVAAADRQPLAVSIESMTPSSVPRRGEVTLTGEIRNRSRSTWSDLQVFLFASDTPMTTSEELEEANATDEALEVGARVTAEGLYDEVPDLDPGESTDYRLSVPVSELGFNREGVYWMGVHVLGTNEEGRIDGADGRARTFIPLMRDTASPDTTMSLVVPLRAPVRRTAAGQLANGKGWMRRLGDEGRLGRLVDLAGTAFDVPLTWVADPAVLEAARSLSDGNPAFDLAPTVADETDPSASPSPIPETPLTESPAPGETAEGEGENPEEQLGALSEEAEVARGWLNDFVARAGEQEVLALPYGDVDVATLLRGDFGGTFENAYRLSEEAMEQLGVEAEPVVAPLSGLIPNAALDHLDPELPLLLSERAAEAKALTVDLPQGSQALLTSEVARVGGPTPTPPFGALALRQRILAEAAVHGLEHGSGRPLVVSTPELWDPGRNWSSAAFFNGFDQPWLRTVSLGTARALSEAEEYDAQLTYTRRLRRRELPVANVLATQELGAAGDVLAALLTENDTIDEQVGRSAMLGSSTYARAYADRARARTREISEQVHRRLSQVYIEGSDLVTMSSETGSFAVTLVNGLDEPVTVGIEAETGTDELEIRSPDLVSLGPEQRATVRLPVRATDIGVHSVRLVPTTSDGRPLGRSTVVKIRSSRVGLVIWLIMGTGAAVFVAAIGMRIVRRMRDRKRTHGPLMKDVPT